MRIKNINDHSRFTDIGPSKDKKVIRTIRNPLKKPVFSSRDSNWNWLLELPSVLRQYNITIHHGIKMSLIQTSKKFNEKEVYLNLQDKRETKF